jgi:hypothetical protein
MRNTLGRMTVSKNRQDTHQTSCSPAMDNNIQQCTGGVYKYPMVRRVGVTLMSDNYSKIPYILTDPSEVVLASNARRDANIPIVPAKIKQSEAGLEPRASEGYSQSTYIKTENAFER